MYKHSKNVIDPRDKSLLQYKSKKFYGYASIIEAQGIEPQRRQFSEDRRSLTGPLYIDLWSSKLNRTITYQHDRTWRDLNGSALVFVFVPYFENLSDPTDREAYLLSKGIELHIYNL